MAWLNPDSARNSMSTLESQGLNVKPLKTLRGVAAKLFVLAPGRISITWHAPAQY